MSLPINTSRKGAIGVAAVVKALVIQGWDVFTPFDDHSPIDLIAIFGIITHRLQVKYRKLNSDGLIDVPLASVVNGKRIPINIGLIDGWAIYVPELDTVAFVHKYALGVNRKRSLFTFSRRLIESGTLSLAINQNSIIDPP
jgi:hypothetical protein